MDLPFVQVIGNGDAFGSGGRFHTSFLTHTGNCTFLMDLGATSIYSIKKHKIDTEIIDFIVLTHFHGDHYGGIPFLLLDAFFIKKRTKPLIIVGPKGVEQEVKKLMDALYPGVFDLIDTFKIEFKEYSEENVIQVINVKIEAFPVIHSPESKPHGVKVSCQTKKIAYSGDTEWTDNLYKLAEDTDLFICECNFLEGNHNGHLSHETLSQKKEGFNTRRMLLTHLGDHMIEHEHTLDFEVAEEGQRYFL